MSQPNLVRLGESGDLQEVSMYGRKLSELWEDGLTREDRAASGKLRRDVISRKRNFLLSYDAIDQAPVDRFEELFQVNDELVLEVTHLTDVQTYTVLMSPFSKERALAVFGGMWNGVVVELKEV
jgi:hypothetical protein